MNRLLQLLVFVVGSPGRCSKDDFAEFCPIQILAFGIPMVWSSVGEKVILAVQQKLSSFSNSLIEIGSQSVFMGRKSGRVPFQS